jgi:putative flippase GtrA
VSGTVTQPIKFVVVGASGFVVNLSTFAAIFGLGVSYVTASVVAFVASSALMYLGNRYFTFRLGRDGFWSAYVRSSLVAAAVAALNTALLTSLVEGAGVDARVGQALSLTALTPIAFALNKRWTFRVRTG